MENKAHALAAGLFVLVASALLVMLALWLARDVADRREYFVSTTEAVTGLQPQAAVRFKGVLVGKVTAIGFDAQRSGQILIRLAVDADAPVTESTFATLAYQGVTGLAYVQLDDKGESHQPLRSADGEAPRIPMRSGLISRLTDQGGEVLSQLQETSRRLNALLNPQNQQAVIGAVDRVGAAAQRVDGLATHLDALLQAQLSPDRVSLPQLVEETRRSVVEVGRTAQRLNAPGGLVDQLSAGAGALSQGAGTLNADTLPRIHRVSDDAARTVQQVQRTVSGLSENPQALIYGSGPVPAGPGEPGFVAPAAAP